MKVLGLVIIIIVILVFIIALLLPNGGVYMAQFLNGVLSTIVGAIIVFFLLVLFKDKEK